MAQNYSGGGNRSGGYNQGGNRGDSFGQGSGNRGGGYAQGGGNRSGGYSQNRGGFGSKERTIPHVRLSDSDYVDRAESIIRKLDGEKKLLTTSKIRNLLSMISSLYDEVRRSAGDKLSKEALSQIQYIRLHFAYEAGRDAKVKLFVLEADILEHLKDIGDSKEQFMLFCRYMEALVAFHRFVGGKE